MRLEGRRVVLGVTGSIAAYKACDVLRGLQKEGAQVRVVMTAAAQELVRPTVFRSLSGSPVLTGMFDDPQGEDIKHIALTEWAELILVAPATANLIGKVASGIADDLLSTVISAAGCPTLFAPGMNFRMWENPVVQGNVRKLKGLGYRFCGPVEGRLASGAVGVGRMADADEIVRAAVQALTGDDEGKGLRVLITAGPTREFIDPVRFISNPSSGRMGYAMAEAAAKTGAEVCLVSGPTELTPPAGVEMVRVCTAEEMRAAVTERVPQADVFVGVAAVADFAPAETAGAKIARADGDLTLALRPTADIIAEVGRAKGDRIVVGFAAEAGEGVERARRKLEAKSLDLVVLNDVTEPGSGFEVETNRVTLIRRDGSAEPLPLMLKTDLARHIWQEVLKLVGVTRSGGVA
ncbi:MAG: bifunctional phosphopantothenoylcysteine decarboxylase/phosphopantothenate--cysteine ligase CoaBC [Armatimonadetes bacterium]|nr:bifunctional phosphopantothenoylcysteine decarboxylase/phosphopantothenate--cysteine ligase CoaBC [Armatimonadota bacterium]